MKPFLIWWKKISSLWQTLWAHKTRTNTNPGRIKTAVLQQPRVKNMRVVVVPYATQPGPQVALSLHTIFAAALDHELQLQLAPVFPLMAEQNSVQHPLPITGATLAVALFDNNIPPEMTHRFVLQLASQVSTILLINETPTKEYSSTETQAQAQVASRQRQAWKEWAQLLGTFPIFVNLDQPSLENAIASVRLAANHPVS
jgi:hypothetical protein